MDSCFTVIGVFKKYKYSNKLLWSGVFVVLVMATYIKLVAV